METNEILNDLTAILREVVKNPALTITLETKASDVDGWDSLTNMLLINQIEKKFEVRFNFREIAHLANVGDMCRSIQVKTNK